MQRRDNRPLRGGPLTWHILKKAFLDQFFPREMREAKSVEFINLHQGGMSVHDYYFKFIELAKYAPSLVSYPRDEMSQFVMGVSDDFEEWRRRIELRGRIGIQKGKVVFSLELRKIVLRFKRRLNLRRDSKIKFQQNFLILGMTSTLVLKSNCVRLGVRVMRNLLVPYVGRVILGNA